MASLWTLITKGYEAYEEEKCLEDLGVKESLDKMKERKVEFVLKHLGSMDLYYPDEESQDEAIQQAHKYAKDLGDSAREKLLYDELKRRGLKPLD